jgi:adhesin/invasin
LAARATDAYGNPAPGVTVTFTAPASGASATFAGSVTTAVTNASGVATSAALTAGTTAGPYTVSAKATGTTTVTFALTNTAGPASRLLFTTQPTPGQTITAGAVTTFKVTVEDTYGNIETADASTQVSLAMTVNPGGSALSCTDTGGSGPVTVSAGVATFTCSLNKAGAGYALGATSSPAHGSVTGNTFTIVAGSASQLVFTSQPPAGTAASSVFATTVSIEDPYGNVVTGDTHTVALSLATNPCGATLAGTTSRAATGGVASFTSLQITKACVGYTLKATDASDGPLTATSAPFAITPATVSKLVFTTQPPASAADNATFAVAVTIEDLYGNVETGDTHSLVVSLGTNPCAGTLVGGGARAAVAGVATYPALQVATVCTGYTLTVSDVADGPLLTTSNAFAITGAAASAVGVSSGSPQFTTVHTAFGSPLVAKVTDALGNPVAGVQVTFAAPASGPSGTFGTCAGGNPTAATCVVASNASGLATASVMTANGTAGAYAVTGTATGVSTPASFSLINSANFTIAGDASPSLLPGATKSLNLVFTNPNPSPITIAAGGVTITISSSVAGCPATPNFAVVHGLTASATVPATATRSLSDLGIPAANWPVVAMVETHTDQDACQGTVLTLHYTGSATG